MIRIRFFRVGRKRQPFYKIVVTNSKNAPSAGRFIEELGFYDPVTKDFSIKEERAKHWISEGASLSDTVYNLLVRKQVIIGKKRAVHSVSKKEVVEEKEVVTEEVPEKVAEEPKKEVVTEKATEEVVEEKEVVTEEVPEKVAEEPKKEGVTEKATEEVVEEKEAITKESPKETAEKPKEEKPTKS